MARARRGLMPRGGGAEPMPAPGGAPGPGGPAPGPGPGPGGPGPEAKGRRASDEEKKVYQTYLAGIVNLLYKPKTAEAVGKVLHGVAKQQGMLAEHGQRDGVSGIEPLAQIAAAAIARASYDGLQEGQPIEPEMAAAAAATIAGEMGQNIPQAVGTAPLSEDQTQALYLRTMELLADEREDRQQGGGGQPGAPGPGGPPGPGAGPGPGPGPGPGQ